MRRAWVGHLLQLLLLCTVFVAPSCTRNDEKEAASASPFAPTTALVNDPELVRRVDALAAATLGGEYRNAKSDVEPRLHAVTSKATRAQLKALLRHESPVVRGHLGDYVARNEAGLLADVAPLLDDGAEIGPTRLPKHQPLTVAKLAIGGICSSTLPDAVELLRDIAARHEAHAVRALGCLLDKKDPHVARLLEQALSNLARPAAVRDYALRVFTIAPLQSQCESIRAVATTEGARSRDLHVAALSRCEDQESFAILDDLAKNESPVLGDAKLALLLHPWTPDARRRELAGERALLELALPRLEARLGAAPGDPGLLKVSAALASFRTDSK